MKIGILGGGVAGVSMARLLPQNHDITILEGEKVAGGLARSYHFEGFDYDVGPHIIFSRDKSVLEYMLSTLPEGLAQYKRSNQIWYKGRLIKYPFENYLGLLPDEEKNECLHSFIRNPYSDYKPENMLQFFLKTFGPGITNTYLRPYNEKIWKYDPAFLDLQMVERIPSPPVQDVIDGANGTPKEGYTHQLHFYYPKQGGTQTFFNAMVDKLSPNAKLRTQHGIQKISKASNNTWNVECQNGKTFEFDRIINCMPLPSLFRTLDAQVPEPAQQALKGLKYNSLYFGVAVFSRDYAGDHFAFNIPEKEIVFHRISKLNFIGEDNPTDKSAFLFEITFREDMAIASASPEQIKDQVLQGLERMEFAFKKDLINIELRSIKHAYVIYDTQHRKNTDTVLNYLNELGIPCTGRFAEHEYVNMDHVIERAMRLTRKLTDQWHL